MNSRTFALLNIFGIALLLTSCKPGMSDLSEKPVRSFSSLPLPPTESTVGFSAQIQYAALRDQFAKAVPKQFNVNGRQNVCVDINETVKQTVQKVVGGNVGKFIGSVAKIITQVVTVNQVRHVCQDIDYHATIRRDDNITVAPNGSALRISIPISVNGGAGFSGDVAKAIDLQDKSFRGSITAFADVTLDIGSDWCPSIQVNPDFVWRDKAQLEVVGRFWINIDGTVGPQLKDAMNKAAQGLSSAITCAQIKGAVTPLWHTYSIPIETIKGQPEFVNFVPKGVGFSGLSYEGGDVRAAFQLVSSTEVATKAIDSGAALPLPSISRISATSDKLSVLVPMRAGYEDLRLAVVTLVGNKTFDGVTPAGSAAVKILDAEIYPAGNDLVIGLRFQANLNNKLLDANGKIYLIAEPWLDSQTQTLKLKHVRFTREIDNKLWEAVSAIFQGEIQSTIEKKSVVELKPQIDILRTYLRDQLKIFGEKQGIVLTVQDNSIGLKQVNLAEKNMEALVEFEGSADINVPTAIALHI